MWPGPSTPTIVAWLVVAALAWPPLFSPGQAATAARGRPQSITDLLAEAERLLASSLFELSHTRVDEALSLAASASDRQGSARAKRMKGRLFNAEGKGPEARRWLEEARAEFAALGDRQGEAYTLTSLAQAAENAGDEGAAVAYAERSIELLRAIGDDDGLASAVLALLQIDEARPAADRAALTAEALAIADALGSDALRGKALQLRGSSEFSAGYLRDAQASLEAAAQAYARIDAVDDLAAVRLMQGRVLRAHGDHEGALALYRRAEELLAAGGSEVTRIEAINASGVALAGLGRHAEAIAAYERGLAVARDTGSARFVDFMLGNLGGGLVAAGEHARAVDVLEQVLARKPEPYIAAFREGQLAIALGSLGRFEAALPHATRSVEISETLGLMDRLDDRLDTRAWILAELGRLDSALADLHQALAVVERVRATLLPEDFLRRGYGDKVQRHYARSVDLLARLGRFSEALDVSEQARARALLDQLAARRAGATSVERTARPLGLDDARALAARLESPLLAYWVGETTTVVWILPPSGPVTGVRLSIGREALSHLVGATTALLRLPDTRGLSLRALARDDGEVWRTLYEALLEPVSDALPAGGPLVIIPHGPLFGLSFGAMRDASGRYLIERYDVSYAPSFSILAATAAPRRPTAPEPLPWLLVGSPAVMPFVDGRPLEPLAAASREIAAIARLAPGAPVIRLESTRASEAELSRRLAAGPLAVLHVTTHGVVSDDRTQPSFLALNPDGAGDGRLTADEVYGLSVRADLVVLSACRTGDGAVTGDGVVGLTRAFFVAGAASVVASLWDVPDETTLRLMRTFYGRYSSGAGKGRSLREAQLALLSDLRAGRVRLDTGSESPVLPEHPLLWAGFFLSGAR